MKTLPTRTRTHRAALALAPLLTIAHPAAMAAEAQSQAQIVIQAPIERVWLLLTDVAQWPQWNPAVESVVLKTPLTRGAEFVWKSQGFSVTSTLQDVQPPTRLSWTGKAFGTRAFHVWTLEPTPAGVVVRTEESFNGWLPRLLRGSMQKKLDETLPQWLASLKRAAESGDVAYCASVIAWRCEAGPRGLRFGQARYARASIAGLREAGALQSAPQRSEPH